MAAGVLEWQDDISLAFNEDWLPRVLNDVELAYVEFLKGRWTKIAQSDITVKHGTPGSPWASRAWIVGAILLYLAAGAIEVWAVNQNLNSATTVAIVMTALLAFVPLLLAKGGATGVDLRAAQDLTRNFGVSGKSEYES